MGIIKSDEAEEAAILATANEIMASIRTAPKTRGVDDVISMVLHGPELETLACKMEDKYRSKGEGIRGAFKRDADCVRRSAAVVLTGIKSTGPKKPEKPLDCGACGFASCAEFMKEESKKGEDFSGPSCIWQTVDLGIALGSAVKTASMANVDNRLMYTIGAAARELGIIDGHVIIGIPLSVSGKNIFFDR